MHDLEHVAVGVAEVDRLAVLLRAVRHARTRHRADRVEIVAIGNARCLEPAPRLIEHRTRHRERKMLAGLWWLLQQLKRQGWAYAHERAGFVFETQHPV